MNGKTNARQCASCGTGASLGAAVARCSQCKWVAYCSRDCQMRHWKTGGHRRWCAILRIVASFRDAEERFWRSRSPSELAAFSETEGLDPSSMHFYGEVLYLLSGLKPSLFFSNLPIAWLSAFVSEVVKQSGVLDASSSMESSPVLYLVAGNVHTPAEYRLQNTLVLVNTSHKKTSSIVQELYLKPIPPALSERIETSAASAYALVVSEARVAHLLDYPIALDECNDDMIEVGYFHALEDGTKVLLSSYCAGSSPAHRDRIRAHFQRYRDHVGRGTLTMACEVTPLG